MKYGLGVCALLTAAGSAWLLHSSGVAPGERAPASLEKEPQEAVVATPSAPPEGQQTTRARTIVLARELEEIRGCYDRDCQYHQTDPKSYSIAIGQDLKAKLIAFTVEVRGNQWIAPEISELALVHLASDDGHVQEAALSLLATQPPTQEALDAILAHVIGGYDAELIAQALVELQRYRGETDRRKIALALTEAMVTGSPIVAKEVSQQVLPFVDSANVSLYEEAASRLLESSLVKANLESNLEEYRRTRS